MSTKPPKTTKANSASTDPKDVVVQPAAVVPGTETVVAPNTASTDMKDVALLNLPRAAQAGDEINGAGAAALEPDINITAEIVRAVKHEADEGAAVEFDCTVLSPLKGDRDYRVGETVTLPRIEAYVLEERGVVRIER
ncbi:hypothetical protein [Hydrocarboniphaga effusa]|uniref:hypothetical protein n=1 Tax=Hydrocarboniphaga effusa TaxID=243629 RepID=UPI003BA87E74